MGTRERLGGRSAIVSIQRGETLEHGSRPMIVMITCTLPKVSHATRILVVDTSYIALDRHYIVNLED